jgi:hypothetical protein
VTSFITTLPTALSHRQSESTWSTSALIPGAAFSALAVASASAACFRSAWRLSNAAYQISWIWPWVFVHRFLEARPCPLVDPIAGLMVEDFDFGLQVVQQRLDVADGQVIAGRGCGIGRFSLGHD